MDGYIPITLDTCLLYVYQQSVFWGAARIAAGSATWKSIRYIHDVIKWKAMVESNHQPGQLSWRLSKFVVGKAEAAAIKQLAAIAAVIGDFIVVVNLRRRWRWNNTARSLLLL